jgi:hypothetical protein
MADRHPAWHELPTVTAALMWLLPPALNATDRTARRRTRLLGLIRDPGRGEWKPNSAAVTRLAKVALRRLPDDPEQLGDILHGLGEIAARSHVSIIEPLIAYLGCRRRLRLDKVFAVAFAREAKTHHPVRLDAVAFVQWLSSATTNWDTLTLALSHVEHGHRFIGGGHYGLEFTARIVIELDARAVDACIRANPNRQRLTAIGNAALAAVFPFDGKARPAALLRSRNAAVRSIGAAALISPLELEIDNIFVETAEIRHRLAEKLSHGANRDWLLKRNIQRLRDFVGLAKSPAEVPTDYFFPDERQFQPLAEWTAQSLSLLYAADRHGIGKRTSFLVSGVEQAATALMAQPFIAARKPDSWQSILTRVACAYRFALMVVANVPQAGRHAVTMLNRLALEHAFAILSHGQVPVQASETFFRLTALAVHNMRY